MPGFLTFDLLPIQQYVAQEINDRIIDLQPTILWAGKMSGKSMICKRLSNSFPNMHQMLISNNFEDVSGYYMQDDDHVHPMELPLAPGREYGGSWPCITPLTIVFIDNLFNLPNAEALYNRVIDITPHVVAMGCPGPASQDWEGNYFDHYVGPYSTWELNPLFDFDTMRNNSHRDPESFNCDNAACVDKDWMLRCGKKT